jgi:hypothetical protein
MIIYFLKILRSLRILKLRSILNLATSNFKKFVLKLKSNDVSATEGMDYDEEGELNRFIIDSLIKFTSGILIESTYFLSLDHFWD